MVSRFSLCLQQPLPWGYRREGLGPFEVTQLGLSGGCPAQRALVAVLLALVSARKGAKLRNEGKRNFVLPPAPFMDMSHQRRLDGVTLRRGEGEHSRATSASLH